MKRCIVKLHPKVADLVMRLLPKGYRLDMPLSMAEDKYILTGEGLPDCFEDATGFGYLHSGIQVYHDGSILVSGTGAWTKLETCEPLIKIGVESEFRKIEVGCYYVCCEANTLQKIHGDLADAIRKSERDRVATYMRQRLAMKDAAIPCALIEEMQ